MKEHNLVTSPEISLKLKKIGCPQDTYFRWVRQIDEIKGELKYIDEYELYNSHDQFSPYICENDLEKEKSSFAAYTVTELLEILNNFVKESHISYKIQIFFKSEEKNWVSCFDRNIKDSFLIIGEGESLENSLADLINVKFNLTSQNVQGE